MALVLDGRVVRLDTGPGGVRVVVAGDGTATECVLPAGADTATALALLRDALRDGGPVLVGCGPGTPPVVTSVEHRAAGESTAARLPGAVSAYVLALAPRTGVEPDRSGGRFADVHVELLCSDGTVREARASLARREHDGVVRALEDALAAGLPCDVVLDVAEDLPTVLAVRPGRTLLGYAAAVAALARVVSLGGIDPTSGGAVDGAFAVAELLASPRGHVAVTAPGPVVPPRFTDRLVVCPPRGSESYRLLEAALVRGLAVQVRYRSDVPASPGAAGQEAISEPFDDGADWVWRPVAAPPYPIVVAVQLRADVVVASSSEAGAAASEHR